MELYNSDPKVQKAIELNPTPVIIEPLIVQPIMVSQIEAQEDSKQLQLNIFDLFENETIKPNTPSPLNQFKTTNKRSRPQKKRKSNTQQINLFSFPVVNSDKASASKLSSTSLRPPHKADPQTINNLTNNIPEPAPYKGKLEPFHRNDSLVVDNDFVGHL